MLHRQPYPSLTCSGTGFCVIAAVFTLLLPLLQFFHDELLYQRDQIAAGEIWRLLSGQLVHTNAWHVLLNIAGLWILALFQPQAYPHRYYWLQIMWLASNVAAGLWYLQPQLQWYAGFSGILYGLFLLNGIAWLQQRDWLTAAVLLLGVCGKTVWDWQVGAAYSPTAALINAPVVYAAHLYGMTGGLLWAMGQWWSKRWHSRKS
ncbi:MAG: rhombosortase [Thiothrix sp.]